MTNLQAIAIIAAQLEAGDRASVTEMDTPRNYTDRAVELLQAAKTSLTAAKLPLT